ncbi:MAG: hypothetical protein ABEJ48_02185 [Halobacteriales archaeon]
MSDRKEKIWSDRTWRFQHDQRAVSTALSYTITLTITAVLISGLLVSGTQFLESEQKRAINSELDVLGNRVAADLAAADRLVQAGNESGNVTLTLSEAIPQTVAGAPYRMNITREGNGPYNVTIELFTTDPSVTVTVGIKTTTPVANTTIVGGPFVIEYDESTDELEVADD